ncbi:MAG TPA: hypothetical protein PKD45_02775 [Flavobacteriales bacterium]|nr:hypothetical protein [Flavobacteriales bacterium]
MQRRPIVIALAALLAACSAPDNKEAGSGDTLVIGGEDASDYAENYYQMPTPNELFQIVRTMSNDGQKQMMSPAKNVERYATSAKKALNFGVYATDLVYASNYKITSEVVRYYITCKKLGDELGLAGSFSDKDFMRLERNLTHGDSLDVISNEAYERAYRRMQDERMGPTLALVLAGGWIESMHLVTRQVLHVDAEDPLVMRVAEQKVSLDLLVDLMEQYKDDPQVGNMRQELLKLRDIYDTFPVIRTEQAKASASGRQVLGEDVVVVITAQGFKELAAAVEALRDDIITPEDIIKPAQS